MLARVRLRNLAPIAGAFFLSIVFSPPLLAACRHSPELEGLQHELAIKYFPDIKDRLPKISACDRADFDEHILGDFDAGKWAIRIITEREDFPVKIVIAHELGHAVAFLQGERHYQFRGHGAIWIRVMIRAGFANEAKRTSNLHYHYPGLDRIYVEVAKLENDIVGKPAWPPRDQLDVLSMLKERPQWWDWLNKPID
jgi:hypothetical protein